MSYANYIQNIFHSFNLTLFWLVPSHIHITGFPYEKISKNYQFIKFYTSKVKHEQLIQFQIWKFFNWTQQSLKPVLLFPPNVFWVVCGLDFRFFIFFTIFNSQREQAGSWRASQGHCLYFVLAISGFWIIDTNQIFLYQSKFGSSQIYIFCGNIWAALYIDRVPYFLCLIVTLLMHRALQQSNGK